MTLGEKIREERSRHKLSLQELANRIGNVSKATLWRIENSAGDKNEPPFSLVVKISNVLGVPIDYFAYGFKSETELVNDTFNEIIDQSGVEGILKERLHEISDLQLKKAIMSLGPLKEFMRQVKERIFRILEIKSKKEISIKGEAVQYWDVEIEALVDDMCYYRHRYLRSEENPFHRYDDFDIDYITAIIDKEEKNVLPAFMAKEPRFVYFNVPFPNPIKKHQKIRLKWIETYKNAHVMSKSFLPEDNNFTERTGYFILYSPTDFFQKEIIFPQEFRIQDSDVYPDVEKRIFEKRFPNHEEIERIKKQGLFSTKIIDGKLSAQLRVKNPKPGSAYFIRWHIPEKVFC